MKKLIYTPEELRFDVEARTFDEMHGVTLCCVVLNEEKIIGEFLEYYKPYVKSIIMIDGGSTDRTIEIATPLVDQILYRKFDGHYSNQANRAVEVARTDWILLMDADERLEEPILKNMKKLIDQEEYDCYSFPRRNFVDDKLDEEHYPDFQQRLYRAYCRRVRPVHGEVVGFKNSIELTPAEGNNIIHKKNGDRHQLRNKSYTIFEMHYCNEMGSPGEQTKENFEKAYPQILDSSDAIKARTI